MMTDKSESVCEHFCVIYEPEPSALPSNSPMKKGRTEENFPYFFRKKNLIRAHKEVQDGHDTHAHTHTIMSCLRVTSQWLLSH